MWATNIDPNGSTLASSYWPGSSNVDMVGVDGYPSFCECGGTFANVFGGTFSEIHKLTSLPIFISETNLAVLGTGSYEAIPQWISDMKAAGGTGVLEFEEGVGQMTSSQWSQLDTAL